MDHQDCDSHIDSIQGGGNAGSNSCDQHDPADKFNESDDHGRNHRERYTGMCEPAGNSVKAEFEQLLVAMHQEHDPHCDSKYG